jgi:hypothetical protein
VSTPTPLVRGAWRALVLATPLAGALLLAGPASAVPEGWSEPGPVNGLAALTVFVFAPLAVIAVTVALVSVPRWAGAARSSPTVTAVEEPSETGLDELFGADEPAELEAPDEDVDDRS